MSDNNTSSDSKSMVDTPSSQAPNMMWGGAYSEPPADIFTRINASISIDKRLYRQDIDGSLAHAEMLARQGIISWEDEDAIRQGLGKIKDEIERGEFQFKDNLEDIHMNIEARLKEIIGQPAGRLHTARSRNDQVATDFRMWVRERCDALDQLLALLQSALVRRANEHSGTIIPGFTHLQSAQPVTLGHHLLAYVEMIARDRSRLQDARARLNECPLGAAALAGTSYPVDRKVTAEFLGFDRPMANSLDAVSARDFALEVLANASICITHLSRLAEECVLWSSTQFRFIRFSDAYASGSSIMPQKRNPDAAELVRGKTGAIYGALTQLLTVMKALPLAYNKDTQEDKEPVFRALDTLTDCVQVMTGMIDDFSVDSESMYRAAAEGHPTATDLADWLVRTLNMPFRNAHHVTAQLVAAANAQAKGLDQLTLAEMQKIEPAITEEVHKVLSIEHSVAARKSYGGTSPACVTEQVRRWKEVLGDG